MAIVAQQRAKIIERHKRSDTDTGSPEVQVALLSEDIQNLTSHLREHPKDVHSRRGLIAKVSQRRKLLDYLKSRDASIYAALIQELGIRK